VYIAQLEWHFVRWDLANDFVTSKVFIACNHKRLTIQGSSKEPEILIPSFAKFYCFEVTLRTRTTCIDWEKWPEMDALQSQKAVLSSFLQMRREMAHPVPNNAFLQPIPDMAMLFALFWWTPWPFLPACIEHPKDIARSDRNASFTFQMATWILYYRLRTLIALIAQLDVAQTCMAIIIQCEPACQVHGSAVTFSRHSLCAKHTPTIWCHGSPLCVLLVVSHLSLASSYFPSSHTGSNKNDIITQI